ncbi:toll-like receptor e [Plakobranchus ocellatus]|uniref:Toll-like receptor e n=1 Tax=Plakobranchus ocellatus TaxID=259542 RepID=A0AAV4BQP9_9GAST|nr:toll-like receptor e [Plakobranchus ocellatus]
MDGTGQEKIDNTEGELSTLEKRFRNQNRFDNSIIFMENKTNSKKAGEQTHGTKKRPRYSDLTLFSSCGEIGPFPTADKHRRQNMHIPTSPTSTSRDVGSEQCCKVYNTYADCRSCHLFTIPTDLPANITVLLLGHNKIGDYVLRPGAFSRYSNLTLLNLSRNKITSLPNGVFQGLPNLQCLCLQKNAIKMDQSLNSSLAFEALSESLLFLKLNRNNNNPMDKSLIYPSFALSFLKNLKYLYLDGIPFKRFENPDRQFSKLTHLTLAGFNEGFCNITGLYNNAFELDALTYLNISDCTIEGHFVNESAFENLKNLQTLDVSNNFDLGIATVGDFMYGLRNNKNFENLVMERINPRFTPCIAIYTYTLRHFKNTGLKRIYAMDNEIEIIEKGALQNLPETLIFLNLTANKIIFGSYLQDLGYLIGLNTLILDGSLKPYEFPYQYPTVGLKNCVMRTSDVPKSLYQEYPSVIGRFNQYIKFIPVPPNLTQLSMARNGMVYTLNNITFSTNNVIKLDLTGNILQYLDGPIRGLENLQTLTMDECFVHFISDRFFDFFPNLQYLTFYRNLLGQILHEDYNGYIFKNLKKLVLLNLSTNNIFRLNGPVFKNLKEMKHLDISQNRLGKVNFSIAHMKQLETINLKGNQIRTLTTQTMKEIDLINKETLQLKIDLSNNPIGCDCDNLKFLEWFTESGVMWDNFTRHPYYCELEYQPDGFKDVIERLRQKCVTHQTLFMIVTCATLFIMLIIVAILAYRFRWTLRHWYHAAKMTVRPSLPVTEYEYDVFVSYSDKDDFVEEVLIPRLQDQYNLRVHLHGLHFRAGDPIADSIHRAVSTSRKTLVVITKNMLRSHWCNYELMVSRREAIARGRQVQVFLFLEPMSSWEVSSDIASYVRESTYIAYPPDPAYRQAFWNKLAHDLGANAPLR